MWVGTDSTCQPVLCIYGHPCHMLRWDITWEVLWQKPYLGRGKDEWSMYLTFYYSEPFSDPPCHLWLTGARPQIGHAKGWRQTCWGKLNPSCMWWVCCSSFVASEAHELYLGTIALQTSKLVLHNRACSTVQIVVKLYVDILAKVMEYIEYNSNVSRERYHYCIDVQMINNQNKRVQKHSVEMSKPHEDAIGRQ